MPTGLYEYTSPTVPAALTGYLAPGVEFEIDNANVDSDLTDAAVLITFTSNAYLGQACADGRDLRFTNADGTTVLDHQKISFSITSSLATGSYIVKCTPTSAAKAKVRCYCSGDTGDTDTSTTDVWPASCKGVWHLGETPTAEAGNFQDATAGNHDSTNTDYQPTHSTGLAPGIGAATFATGSNQRITFANGIITGTTSLTIEKVVKFGAITVDRTLSANRSSEYMNWQIIEQNDGQIQFGALFSGTPRLFNSTGTCTTGSTYHLAVTYDGSYIRWYINGVMTSETAETGTIDSNSVPTHIGWENFYGWFDGDISEFRLYNVALSAAQIKFNSAQMLQTDHELAVSNVLGTWAAVDAGDITGKVILACDVATTSTAAWAEVEDPERANYILNSSGVYADRYTLSTAQWRACLIPMWKSTLSDDAETLRRVGQISATAAKLPARVRYFSGDVVYPYDVPFATQMVQTPADAAQRWPEYERDIS
jgi:hypothetical protein